MAKIQTSISSKLGNIEIDLNDLTDTTSSEKQKADNEKSQNEYKKKLNDDLDYIMGKVDDNIISKNYLNFYDFLMKRDRFIQAKAREKEMLRQRKLWEEEQRRRHKETANKFSQANIDPREFREPTLLKISVSQKQIAQKQNPLARQILQKKQNVFLSNEITNLKLKLNKINNQNKILNSLLKTQVAVGNAHFLDKFVESFVESLAINWSDIVNQIIDELLEQEVYELNRIELEKINYDQIRLTTFADILKDAPRAKVDPSVMFDNFAEIGEMVSKIKKQEELIGRKYNFKK